MAVEEERALVGVAGDATPDFLAVDFLCGAGGTTRGLIDANGYVIAGVDKDARCDDTYVRNNVNTKIDGKAPAFLHRDIFPSTAAYPDGEQGRLYKELSELVRAKRSLMPSVPLLFAICAPCQPFTTLSRKTLSDERKEGRERDAVQEAFDARRGSVSPRQGGALLRPVTDRPHRPRERSGRGHEEREAGHQTSAADRRR